MFKQFFITMFAFALSATINLADLDSGAEIYAKGEDKIQATQLTVVDGETEKEITQFPYSLEDLEEKDYTLKSGEKTFTLHMDNTAPVISTNVKNQTYKSLTGEVTAEGAEKTKILLNNKEVRSPFEVTDNGDYELKITAIDKAGNESGLERNFKIYNTSPVIKVNGIDKEIQNSDYHITVSATSDIPVETVITLNGEEVASPINVSEEGKYELVVVATDELGNSSEVTKTFEIDKSAPEVIVEGIEKSIYNTDVTYKITGADTIKLNGEEISSEGTISEEGSYVLVASATNEAGTTSTVKKEFRIKKSAPDITVKGIDKTYYNSNVNYEVSSEDGEVSVAINGQEVGAKGTLSEEDIYTMEIEAVDEAGNTSSLTKEFIIDKTAPPVSITGVANGFYNKDVTYQVTSTDEYTVTLNGKTVTPGKVSNEGDYILVVESTDKAGNHTTREIKFTIDKTAPKINYNNEDFVTDLRKVKADIEDNNLSNVKLTATHKDEVLKREASEHEIYLLKDFQEKSENDAWVFFIVATDKAGNKSELKKTIIRDTVAPEISLSKVKKYINKNVNMTAVIKDPNEAESVMTITRNGKDKIIKGTKQLKETLSKEGFYEIHVSSEDKAGNKSLRKTSFTIDKTKPVTTLHTSSGHVKSADDAKVYSNENGATYIKVVLDGKTIFNKRASSYSNFSKNGNYAVSAYSIDLAGNKSEVKTKKFTVDNVSPKISLTGAAQGKYYNKSVTLTASVKERFYKTTTVNVSGTIESKGGISIPFTCTGQNTSVSKTFSQNGIYHIKMTAADKAGNSASTKELSFIIDTVNPEVTIDVPENGGYDTIIAPKVTIKDEFFDSKRISLTKEKPFKDNFGKTGGTRTYADFQKIRENDGIYIITASATDKAGNSKSVTKTFTVNRFGSTFKVIKKPDDYGKEANKDVVIEEKNVSGIKEFKCRISKDASEFEAKGVKTKKKDDVTTYTIPKSNFAEEGVYKVYIESLDNTGNKSKSKTDFSFTVDKTPPVITYKGVESGKTYKQDSVRMNISAIDSLSKDVNIKVSVDGRNVEVKKDENTSYAEIGSGYEQNVVITAVDKAGNTSTSEIENVSISTSKFSFFATHKILTAALLILLAGLAGILLLIAARKKKKDRGDDITL